MTYGLYVHIPFCIKKCAYCDFTSSCASEEEHSAYFSALEKEIGQRKGKRLDSIFVGGGTPSCVSARYIASMFDCIYKNMTVSANAEITLEANPGTLTEEKLKIYKSCGVNRISLGVQSFQDNELHALGRIHSAQQTRSAAKLISKAGFENFNIDLMLATPYQTCKSLSDTLEKAAALLPTHISAYSLIVEPKTPFYDLQKKGALPLPDEDLERALANEAAEFLDTHGYIQYEISNYAKKGYECRHNLKYWQCMPYIGVGAAAHSYDGTARTENTADTKEYICLINAHTSAAKSETVLSDADKVSEYIIMVLRLTRGIVFDEFFERFGFRFEKKYENIVRKYAAGGFFAADKDRVCFTKKGFAVSNTILSEFV